MIKYNFILLIPLLLLGCANLPEDFPDIKEEESQITLIIGSSDKGRHLNQFPICSSEKVLCLDPPPVLLKTRVLADLDNSFEKHILIATRNHFGTLDYELTESMPFLMKIETNGKEHILLKYQRVLALTDKFDRLFIPLFGSEQIHFLPCEINQLAQPININFINTKDFIKIEEFEDDNHEIRTDYQIHKGRIIPSKALYFKSIIDYMNENPNFNLEGGCDE